MNKHEKENVFKFVYNRKHMFEDDGIKIVREVEPCREYRGKYEKKKNKKKLSPEDPDR